MKNQNQFSVNDEVNELLMQNRFAVDPDKDTPKPDGQGAASGSDDDKDEDEKPYKE